MRSECQVPRERSLVLNIRRELSRACEQFIKQEDEGKFRCKTCQKLFKATSFVEKHIANKHADLIKHLDEVSSILTLDVGYSHIHS